MAARDNPFYISPPNIYDAVLAGDAAYTSARKQHDENELKRGRLEAVQALQTGGDLRTPLAKLIGIGDYKGAAIISDFAKNQQAGNSVYGTPIYGTTPDGQTGIGTFDKNGQFRRIDTGGFQVTPGVKTIDTPQGVVVIDSKGGRPVSGAVPAAQPGQAPGSTEPIPQNPVRTQSFYPKDYRNTESDKVVGRETGEKAAALGKARMAVDAAANSLDRLSETANRIKNDPALGRITGIPGMLPNVPGGKAADVQAQLETLKSQAANVVLQAMRDASKTGGAVGQVSNFEQEMFMNNLAAVSRAQSKEEFKRAMDRIIQYSEGAKGRLKAAYDQDYGGLQRPSSNMQPGTGGGNAPRVPSSVTPQGLINWARANRIPSGSPIILPDGTQGFVP